MPLKSGQLVTYAAHMKSTSHDVRDIYNFSMNSKGLWIGRNKPKKEPFLVVSSEPGFRALLKKSYWLTVFLSEGAIFKFISSEDPVEHFVVTADT